jgi:hypothetical protein
VDRARGIGDHAHADVVKGSPEVAVAGASTTLLLSEPPLRVPGWQRPMIRTFGRILARRFVRCYQHQTGATVAVSELRWHQAVVCLGALVEVAGWVEAGVADARAGYPWLVSGPAFARRLTAFTGVPVRAR